MKKPGTCVGLFCVVLLLCLGSCGYDEVEDDGRAIVTCDDAWGFYNNFPEQIRAVGDTYYEGNSILPMDVIELCALLTARYWNADQDWLDHQTSAVAAGLDPSVMQAIYMFATPDFNGDRVLATAYRYAVEILTCKKITDVTYADVLDIFGEKGPVELAGIVGHHTMIAMTLNGFRLFPEAAPLLPPGEWTVERDFSEVDTPRRDRYGLPFSVDGWPQNRYLSRAENTLATTFPFRSDRLHELAIIITARKWNAIVPWSAHVRSAVDSGIAPEAARAIGFGEDPTPYMADDEIVLYQLATNLFDTTTALNESKFNAAADMFGRPKLVKLVTVMGYYSQVSLVVNTVGYTLYELKAYPFPMP